MRVGVIGLGDRAAYLAKVFSAQIPNFEVVAHADPAPVTIEALKQSGTPIGSYYADHSAMLAQEKLDLVLVGSPNHLHLQHIGDSLRAGARVFAEKPVVISEDQSLELLGLLREFGRDSVMIGLVLRYAPIIKDLRAQLSGGALGEIMSIEAAEHIAPEHGAFFMRDWRRRVELSGGFLLEKCCHDLDIYQEVAGSRPVRLASFGSRKYFNDAHGAMDVLAVYHSRKSRWGGVDTSFRSDANLIDNQVAIIEYGKGVNFAFHTNLNVPDEYRRFSIIGTRGMAEGDFVRGYLKVHDALTGDVVFDRKYHFDETNTSMHYGAEEEMAADLTAHFELGQPLPVSVVDGLSAGLTAIKLDEARQTSAVIDMRPVWDRFDAALG